MLDANGDRLTGLTAYLSLGSNVGDREANLLGAIRSIGTDVGRVLRASSLYETEPVGCPPMADFLNAVVAVQSLLSSRDLLKRLQALEGRFGRRNGHNEPRPLDIDIITLGDRVIQTDELIVPHPRYRQRLFVLLPLQEVAPDFRCPVYGDDIGSILATLPGEQGIERVSGRWIAWNQDQNRSHYVFSDQTEAVE